MNFDIIKNADKKILSMLEVSIRNPDASQKDIDDIFSLFQYHALPAICVLPKLVSHTHQSLGGDVFISGLINFPSGYGGMEDVLQESFECLKQGAQGVDVIVPFDTVKYDDGLSIKEIIEEIGKLSKSCIIKAIIEVNHLQDLDLVKKAAGSAAMGGADFISLSSTQDDIPTPLLHCALDVISAIPGKIGIKTPIHDKDPESLISQIESKMGIHWCHKKRFKLSL